MSAPFQTKRLLIRELAPSDEDVVAAMFEDPEVMRFVGSGKVLNRDKAAAMIERERANYQNRGWGQWAVIDLKTGRMIGVVGLILWPKLDGKEELEVAYMFVKSAWGKGFATEAAKAVKEFGLTIRPDPVCLIYPDNEASIAVAAKLGMVYEKDVPFERKKIGLYRLAS